MWYHAEMEPLLRFLRVRTPTDASSIVRSMMPHVVTDGTYAGLLPKVVLERIVVDAPPASPTTFHSSAAPFDLAVGALEEQPVVDGVHLVFVCLVAQDDFRAFIQNHPASSSSRGHHVS